MTETGKGRAWGVGAFTAYGLFVVFVLGMVLFASLQRSELAEDHPYERGLAYQTRVDRIRNTARNDGAIAFEHLVAEKAIVVRFPNLPSEREISGEIRLLRPSNASLDRRWPVRPDANGAQEIPVSDLVSGLWRVEIDWMVDSVGYYYQTRLMFP